MTRRPDLDLRSPHWRSVNGDSDMRRPTPVAPSIVPDAPPVPEPSKHEATS
jgi:hypothetical protein